MYGPWNESQSQHEFILRNRTREKEIGVSHSDSHQMFTAIMSEKSAEM